MKSTLQLNAFIMSSVTPNNIISHNDNHCLFFLTNAKRRSILFRTAPNTNITNAFLCTFHRLSVIDNHRHMMYFCLKKKESTHKHILHPLRTYFHIEAHAPHDLFSARLTHKADFLLTYIIVL